MLSFETSTFRSRETTSLGDCPPFRGEGEFGLSLPTETGSYGAAPLSCLAEVWSPFDLRLYLHETYAELEGELEKQIEQCAHNLFTSHIRQLLQRERGSLGICGMTFGSCEVDLGRRSGPTSVGVTADEERTTEERWRRVGQALEVFRSLEEGWDAYGAPAPNQASIAVAQTLLRNLQHSVSVPRIMLDAEGDVVMTWDVGDGAVFLTVERSKLHLLIKSRDAAENEEFEYRGAVPRRVFDKLPKGL